MGGIDSIIRTMCPMLLAWVFWRMLLICVRTVLMATPLRAAIWVGPVSYTHLTLPTILLV